MASSLPLDTPVQIADAVVVGPGSATAIDINYHTGVRNLSVLVKFAEGTISSYVEVFLWAGMDGVAYPINLINAQNTFGDVPFYYTRTISNTGPYSYLQLSIDNADSVNHTFSAWIEAD